MRYSASELKGLTVAALLVIAKELNIKGRHKLRRDQLASTIYCAQHPECNVDDFVAAFYEGAEEAIDSPKPEESTQKKSRDDYVNNIKEGAIVAFTICHGEKTLSGMVTDVRKTTLIIATKNGVKFRIKKENIVWVKTRDSWPRGVYEALKGIKNNEN